MKLFIRLAGLSGIWSDNTNDFVNEYQDLGITFENGLMQHVSHKPHDSRRFRE